MKRFLIAAAKAACMLAFIAAASMAGGALVMLTRPADASRDAAGTYTLPANSENPAVSGTPIKSADHNATMNDVKTELTDSLSRSAKGAMLAQLKLFDGVLATPGLGWGSETGTGWRRAAAGDIRFVVSGADKEWLSATGLGIGAAATYPLDVGVRVGGTAARFTAASMIPIGVATRSSQAGIGFNGTHDDTNWIYGTTNGLAAIVGATDASLIFYTAPSGTAGTAATITERFRINTSGATISTGVAVDGSGFKHGSVAGCTTAASVGATCSSTLTWTTTFADANYHATCGCNGTTGVPVVASYSVSAASVAITTAALTASAATCTNISCVAVHN